MAALAQILGALAIVTGLSGCVLLDLLIGGPILGPDSSFPPFPIPSSGVELTSGRATIQVEGGETVVLETVVTGSRTDGEFGTQVTWRNDAGWYLRFYGYPEFEGLPGTYYISLDRVFDNQHWTMADPSRCITTEDEGVAAGIAGAATCRGARWSDFFASPFDGAFPVPLEGQPPFDAEITFEAH